MKQRKRESVRLTGRNGSPLLEVVTDHDETRQVDETQADTTDEAEEEPHDVDVWGENGDADRCRGDDAAGDSDGSTTELVAQCRGDGS